MHNPCIYRRNRKWLSDWQTPFHCAQSWISAHRQAAFAMLSAGRCVRVSHAQPLYLSPKQEVAFRLADPISLCAELDLRSSASSFRHAVSRSMCEGVTCTTPVFIAETGSGFPTGRPHFTVRRAGSPLIGKQLSPCCQQVDV